jgi:hypothetical protein
MTITYRCYDEIALSANENQIVNIPNDTEFLEGNYGGIDISALLNTKYTGG